MADSDDEHEQHFESSSGASLTYPVQCSALRKNGHVVIKDRPCKIVDITTANSHGEAKVHLIAIDIFTGKKLEDISSSTYNMDVPNVRRLEYQLVNIDDGYLNLMDNVGVPKDDVKVPEGDLGKQLQESFESGKDLLVTVLGAMNEEAAISCKELTQAN
ncbi:Eukaryotic translation initiation factor 5A [Mortierella hygrophila]|uniref:Eukaryotic translation initiation factor 5A n=1 Tax=Mortierella hygrophila TaxID=979708 RepID=A0A9P6EYY2_9FUNG|nr:Eukaryotic translation initiation factor 5A [Mortierella hygrophila]